MTRLPVGERALFCAAVCLCMAAMAGCATSVPPKLVEQTRLETDVRNTQQDLQGVEGRIQELETAQKELHEELGRAGVNDAREKAEIDRRLAGMEAQIKAVDSAREADKQETIDRLSQKIAELLNKRSATQQSQRPGTAVRSPRESYSAGGAAASGTAHVVKERESLSTIARQYGTSVDAIVEANQLKDPDSIRVGQRLIISR